MEIQNNIPIINLTKEQIKEALNELIDEGLFANKNINLNQLIENAAYKIINESVMPQINSKISVMITDIQSNINRQINVRIDAMVDSKLREQDISSRISDEIRKELKNQFKPVMEEAMRISMNAVNKRIQQTLKSVINLKTSTVSEVKYNINTFVDDEQASLNNIKQLENYEGDKRYIEWFKEAESHKYMIKNTPLIPDEQEKAE